MFPSVHHIHEGGSPTVNYCHPFLQKLWSDRCWLHFQCFTFPVIFEWFGEPLWACCSYYICAMSLQSWLEILLALFLLRWSHKMKKMTPWLWLLSGRCTSGVNGTSKILNMTCKCIWGGNIVVIKTPGANLLNLLWEFKKKQKIENLHPRTHIPNIQK